MDEEDNSKAAAVSSIANRLERRGRTARLVRRRAYLFPAVPTRAPAAPSAAKKRRSAVPPIEVSGYDLPNGFHAPRGVIRTHHRRMISNRQLAQNEKRKSEHDACRKDRSDLGKRRCTVSRSKFRCLIPPARTKNVHVGLHLATGSRAHSPTAGAAFPRKWEHRCEEIIARRANAPFAIVEQSPGRNFDQRR